MVHPGDLDLMGEDMAQGEIVQEDTVAGAEEEDTTGDRIMLQGRQADCKQLACSQSRWLSNRRVR